ncbi:MAG TPA: hypothetical protein VMT46_08040 [Anaerolineaceae bacterium]|nr:hypothetical protein [Anaerolineaceae bacterium]
MRISSRYPPIWIIPNLPCNPERYIWDCATLPEYRQKYLYSAQPAYILAELRIGPYSRAWIDADLDNVPSQLGIARAGFHHIADLLIQGFWRCAWSGRRERPGCPKSSSPKRGASSSATGNGSGCTRWRKGPESLISDWRVLIGKRGGVMA